MQVSVIVESRTEPQRSDYDNHNNRRLQPSAATRDVFGERFIAELGPGQVLRDIESLPK
jgi:hypothetical protein